MLCLDSQTRSKLCSGGSSSDLGYPFARNAYIVVPVRCVEDRSLEVFDARNIGHCIGSAEQTAGTDDGIVLGHTLRAVLSNGLDCVTLVGLGPYSTDDFGVECDLVCHVVLHSNVLKILPGLSCAREIFCSC